MSELALPVPIRSLSLLLVAPAIFVILCGVGLERSLAQFIVAPVLLFALLRLRMFEKGVPRPVLMLVAAGTLLSAYYNFSPRGDPSRTFYVSRLKYDSFETESRIFREEMNKRLEIYGGAVAARHPKDTQTIEDALAVLKSEPRVQGLIWGSTRWINISLRSRENLTLGSRGVSPAFRDVAELELVESVPAFGLSYLPRMETVQFITELFSGILPVTNGILPSSSPVWSRRILSLRSAAGQLSRWTSFSHRSYPWLVIGNLHFIAAFENERFQIGELRCAIDAYSRARKLLRLEDNPELLAAILSNKGTALLVKGILRDKADSRWMGRELLRRAIRITHVRNPYKIEYVAPKVARRNLKKLRGWAGVGMVDGSGQARKGKKGTTGTKKLKKQNRKTQAQTRSDIEKH